MLIADFSTEIRPLIDTKEFLLLTSAKRAFETLKKDLGDVTMMSVDENQSFVVNTDARNITISTTRNQNGKPVVFFSRLLNKPQKMYPIVEKEAVSLKHTRGTRRTRGEGGGLVGHVGYRKDT